MKKAIALVLVISLAIFMLFSVSGCFNIGQKVAEKVTEKAVEKAIESEGGEAEVDITEGEVSVKTDESEITVGEGVELPEGFPKIVPVYPDIEILSSLKSTEDGKQTFSVSGTTSDSGNEVFNWYKSQLGGWEIESEFTSESEGEIFSSISANNGTYSLVVTIIETDEGTTVGIVVNEM
ncbi:MAG: hypothetical protein FJW63_07335 [Actinobacteria bacterium]|nr:hypothetical protein [Actinomycetota bacterium]